MRKEPIGRSKRRAQEGSHDKTASAFGQIARLFTGVSSYAAFCFDSSGAILTWNPGVESILGYSRNQFLGMPFSTLFTAEDRHRSVPEDEVARAVQQGEASDDRWHVRADGSRVFVAGFVTPVRDDSNTVQGFLKLVRDRTDFIESADRLRRRGEAAEAANREKDAFVAVLAHELRQPLAAILGWTRMGADARFPRERSADIFDRIRRSAETTMRVVNDLLDVSRIASGKLQLVRERTDFTALLEDTMPELAPAASARGVSLSVEAGSAGAVDADPVRIRQVISNLVGNAIKYTPAGGVIHVAARTDRRDAIFTVSDTGIGIAEQDLPHIFDRFRQSRVANDGQTGLGLGLWVVREIVHRHGGRIVVSSDGEGKGATFTVRLPCAPPAA
jgi:two-component system CheB/CheR fusion protein